MVRRVRVLIYESETPERMEKQRLNDCKTHEWGDGDMRMTIRSIELDPLRITVMELLRLFWREMSK